MHCRCHDQSSLLEDLLWASTIRLSKPTGQHTPNILLGRPRSKDHISAVWLPQRLKVTQTLHPHLEHHGESRQSPRWCWRVVICGSCPALVVFEILTAGPEPWARSARGLLAAPPHARHAFKPGRSEPAPCRRFLDPYRREAPISSQRCQLP
ncbi:hypothetical protein GWK47_048274 [Chionoecetes opilio]|uniref:Uncharacterized protein n=1 Tax=Chionoecetes opilio TaxID=41210 RepID=A0A8J5CUA9_CHIOP|nr:hypothetical protein GWK47_048274 [Chionoecetes opilio]